MRRQDKKNRPKCEEISSFCWFKMCQKSQKRRISRIHTHTHTFLYSRPLSLFADDTLGPHIKQLRSFLIRLSERKADNEVWGSRCFAALSDQGSNRNSSWVRPMQRNICGRLCGKLLSEQRRFLIGSRHVRPGKGHPPSYYSLKIRPNMLASYPGALKSMHFSSKLCPKILPMRRRSAWATWPTPPEWWRMRNTPPSTSGCPSRGRRVTSWMWKCGPEAAVRLERTTWWGAVASDWTRPSVGTGVSLTVVKCHSFMRVPEASP